MDRNDRSIIGLVMLGHGLVHTYEMAIPLFLIDWLLEFETISLGFTQVDVTTASIGVAITIAYGLFGVGALPGGLLVDRLGSRRLIVGCLLGMGTAYLLLGLAPNMLVIAFALVVWGVAASVYHPAGLSLISKGITERGTGFAYHGIAGNLGIGLGPLLAAVLLLFVGWRSVALVFAVPALAATVYASRARFDETAAVTNEPVANGGESPAGGVTSLAEFITESRRLFAGGFLLVFVAVMCSGLFYRGILTFLPELLQDMPGFDPVTVAALLPDALQEALGVDPASSRTLNPQDYFYSGILVIGVVGQYVGGKLTDRLQVEYGLAVAFGVLALLAIAFVPVSAMGIVPLMGLGAVLGVFLFVVQPLYQATVAKYSPAGTRGVSYGYTYLGVFGIGAIGGGVAGTILAYATVSVLFGVLATIATVASLTGLYLARSRPA